MTQDPKSSVGAGSPSPTTSTVLAVDDSAAVLEAIRAILEAQVYTILTGTSGQDALRICEGHGGPIHLMLTDVHMPNMDGPTLAERVTLLRPEIRVVYMSGYSESTIRRRLAPDAHVLQKPFTPDELTRIVRDVLRGEP